MGRQFVTAGEGLTRIFWGQLLALAALVPAFAAVLFAAPWLAYLSTAVGAVGIVFEIMGMNEASLAHAGFRSAILAVAVKLAARLMVNVIRTGFLHSLFSALDFVAALLAVYLVCKSAASLLMEKGEEPCAERGARVWKEYAGCVVAAQLCALASGFFYGNMLGVVLSGALMALQFLSIALYMSYLWRAQRTLKQ